MSGNYDQWELKPEQPAPVSGGSGSSTRNGLIWALVVVVAIALVAVLGSLVWGVKTERISLPFGNQTQVSSSSVAETPAEETATKTVTQTQTEAQGQQEPAQRESTGLISSVQTSRGTVVPASLACDGHYVLIVQSVMGGDNSSTRQELARALERDSGLQYATPGQCPSLRPSYEGKDVYAVYFDAGSAAEACSLKSQWGGNVRAMKNEADYRSDPC
ncbi:hypothetical protein [uncultured Corynebacterium sp.]|uniref:hypothetical protein n=1 Tax=uncultured Corynebacterium sp. TaxID=159447 RepID=UPI00260B87EB|nr:hypothetical protein [uncultured Corynebacterium sp.]